MVVLYLGRTCSTSRNNPNAPTEICVRTATRKLASSRVAWIRKAMGYGTAGLYPKLKGARGSLASHRPVQK